MIARSLIVLVVIFQIAAAADKHVAKSTTTTTKKAAVANHVYVVHKVADGDTATLKNKTSGQLVRVRFLCIDAPEKSQPKWGAESLKKLLQLLPTGSDVTLNVDKIDLYGRVVAEIITKAKINVNKKMVEIGQAVHYPFQKGCDAYADLEKTAKKNKIGVWSDPTFQLPWTYRENNGIGVRGQNKKGTTTKAVKSKTTKATNKK